MRGFAGVRLLLMVPLFQETFHGAQPAARRRACDDLFSDQPHHSMLPASHLAQPVAVEFLFQQPWRRGLK